ncbi:hypothetical protein BLNAU_14441 [Blattamonas nauphoetae]|uniref:Uncharacterized protein n=1 Tax=Blattamonas nauphoetae TaxID=2049346 RepID=A0ABQ9XKG1_9EUKA|nr:hypothetical protein BLNAU_14441 [Blattamonas nauphoetae]
MLVPFFVFTLIYAHHPPIDLFDQLYYRQSSHYSESSVSLRNETFLAKDLKLTNTILSLSGSLFSRLVSDDKSSFMFDLSNATFSSNTLHFQPSHNQPIALISSDSHLLFHLCTISQEASTNSTFISNGGSLTLSSIRLDILGQAALVAPIISSTNEESRISLSGVDFGSISLRMDTPFLTSGPSSTVHLSASRFRNISTSLLSKAPSHQYSSNHVSSLVVVTTTMEHSEMPYQGALTDFGRAESLLVLNSSFLHLRNGQTYNDRIELTTSATYTNDVFINIVAPVEPVDPAEPVEPVDPAEPVDPVEPVVTSGGAIHCTGGTLTLEKCHFENVSSGTMGDGGAVFSSGDEVKADHFREMLFNDRAMLRRIQRRQPQHSPTREWRRRALYIHLKEGHHIVDSLFQDCTAPSFGGGIFVDNAADPKILPYYFKFAFCMFIGTKGQNDETTIPDFFKGKNADGKSRVEGVATDSISGETHNIRFGKASNQNLDNKFLAQNPIVSITGSDSPTCGSEESPCRTVSNAGLFIKTGYTIRVQEGDFKTEGSNDENNVLSPLAKSQSKDKANAKATQERRLNSRHPLTALRSS